MPFLDFELDPTAFMRSVINRFLDHRCFGTMRIGPGTDEDIIIDHIEASRLPLEAVIVAHGETIPIRINVLDETGKWIHEVITTGIVHLGVTLHAHIAQLKDLPGDGSDDSTKKKLKAPRVKLDMQLAASFSLGPTYGPPSLKLLAKLIDANLDDKYRPSGISDANWSAANAAVTKALIPSFPTPNALPNSRSISRVPLPSPIRRAG